jgi:hypothetical protein
MLRWKCWRAGVGQEDDGNWPGATGAAAIRRGKGVAAD